MEELTIKQRRLNDGIEIKLIGELVFIDSQKFMTEIPFRAEDYQGRVVLDMKELKFIDSAGLGALLYISEALRLQGMKMVVRSPNKNNLQLLKRIHNIGNFTIENPPES